MKQEEEKEKNPKPPIEVSKEQFMEVNSKIWDFGMNREYLTTSALWWFDHLQGKAEKKATELLKKPEASDA